MITGKDWFEFGGLLRKLDDKKTADELFSVISAIYLAAYYFSSKMKVE